MAKWKWEGPFYSGPWHRDGHRFLKRQRKEFLGLPVPIFGIAP